MEEGRTANMPEGLFGEARRRTKVIGHAFGERAVLKLMYASSIRVSQTWQRVAINEFERRQIVDLRNELDEQFRQTNGTESNNRIPSQILQRKRDLTAIIAIERA